MKYTKLEIIIPVFNEGEKIIKLMNKFDRCIKTNFKVLICYDLDNDNLFEYQKKLSEYKFEIIKISK